MTKKIYTAAVIGCGKIGVEVKNYAKNIQPGTHAGAYDANPCIKLVGLADVNNDRLKAASKYFPKVPRFNSAEKLLQSVKPDIISIATPPDHHAPLVKLAAFYKAKAILCEKPIAHSIADAQQMIDVCRKNNSLLFINHNRHFDPLIRQWAKKIQQEFIGEIFQGTCYYYNGLFNNATHTIDLLRLFLGEIKAVQAWVNKKTSSLENDPNFDALLFFKKSARVAMQTLPKNYGFANIYFYGTTGRLALKNLGYEIEYQRLIPNKTWKNFWQLASKSKTYGQPRSYLKSVVNYIVSCLDKKSPPISTGKDGRDVLKILLALKASAKQNGKLIALKL